ncbi:MAG: hypothetical protein PHS80_05250 [Methanothrix sp.]|nr:hypothetical protein [Methanothrix sp.]MDD4447050.1 hypothetical protein [Methanothrix sp.]
MKRVIVILLLLLAAADLLLGAALSSESGFTGMNGPDGAVVSLPGADTKKVEDRMADALARLDSWKKAQAKVKMATKDNSTQANSTKSNSTSGNSTLDNNSIISTPVNSSLLNDANSPAGLQKVGSSSDGRFKGYYGMTASRHEMGKSGINSHTFLSGNFEMDKTVKFQDQGMD